MKKDVTDYVTIDDTALTADDDFVTVTYKYGMYRDKTKRVQQTQQALLFHLLKQLST